MTRGRAYLIEPQTLFAPYLASVLERAGYAVVETARDVDPKAIGVARPSVVFVDVDFFERGGATALCRIHEALGSADLTAQRPALVAYTLASDDATHRAACYISGATLVCSKTATEDELAAALRGATALAAENGNDAAADRLRPKSAFGE